MADPLASARVKLRRANLHAATTKREAGRFFKSHPYPTFGGEFEGDPSILGSEGRVLLYVARGYPDPPESFSARFGDAIHNYRCALDHIAWQLVLHGSTPEPEKPRRVQFPIYDSRTKFRKYVAERLPGVGEKVHLFIESRHPDGRGDRSDNALLTLADLSNNDKHKTIHVVATTVGSIETNFQFTDFDVRGFFGPPSGPRLEEGVVVAGARGVFTGPNPEAQARVKPSGYVALEDGGPVIDILAAIRAEVEEIISAPEILAALA